MSGVNTIGLSANERASELEKELADQRASGQLAGTVCIWMSLIAGAAIMHPIADGSIDSIADYLKCTLAIIVFLVGFLVGVGSVDAKEAW